MKTLLFYLVVLLCAPSQIWADTQGKPGLTSTAVVQITLRIREGEDRSGRLNLALMRHCLEGQDEIKRCQPNNGVVIREKRIDEIDETTVRVVHIYRVEWE